MSKFFELVGYEYRKMIMQRFSIIVILLGFFVVVIAQLAFSWTVSTSDIERGGVMAAMREDRTYARKIAGQPLTSDLLISSLTATHRVAYNEVFQFWMRTRMFGESIDELKEFMENFYTIRHADTVGGIHSLYERGLISTQGLEHMLQLNESIPEPWALYYTRGYNRFFTTHLLTGIVIAFVIAVSVAPIFAYEHSTNVAQLILVSKYGKSKMIRAKVFAAISFGMLASMVFFGSSFLLNMAVLGFDGAAAPFQLFDIHSPFPLTMGRAVFIFITYSILRTVMFTAVLVFLSAKIKSSFVGMIFAGVWIISAALIYIHEINDAWLANALRLFVHIIPQLGAAFSIMPYEVFGMIVPPYVFEPLVAIIMGMVLLPLAGRAFARHTPI